MVSHTSSDIGVPLGSFSAPSFNYRILPLRLYHPGPVALSLYSFAAYLASHPTIRRCTTLWSHICHVKALWGDAAYCKTILESQLLTAVLRGACRALPAPPEPAPHLFYPSTAPLRFTPTLRTTTG